MNANNLPCSAAQEQSWDTAVAAWKGLITSFLSFILQAAVPFLQMKAQRLAKMSFLSSLMNLLP